MIAVVEVLVGFSSGPRPMEMMVNLYAFGAILAHLLSLISLVKLRISDPYTPRPYKMPFNLRVRSKEIPILAMIAILFTSALLALVLWTHPLGRFVGPAWVLLWILYYLWYRKRSGFPLIGNLKRDWESDQIAILASTGELDLLEEYQSALAERDKVQ